MPKLIINGKTILVSAEEARAIAQYIREHRIPIQRNQLSLAEATKRCLIEMGKWQGDGH